MLSTPPAQDSQSLADLVEAATASDDPREAALTLFVDLARAQPFEDGNKRTALFAANAHLLDQQAGELLTIPVELAAEFNDLLARAYIHEEDEGAKRLLRDRGFTTFFNSHA